MNDILWTPSIERISGSQLARFMEYLKAQHGLNFNNYQQLHRWSIEQRADFWQSFANFSEIIFSRPCDIVLRHPQRFVDAGWFDGSRLNFAQNLLRYRDDKPALVSYLESGRRQQLSYAELFQAVAHLAQAMRDMGVVAGDRVAAFMPNINETVIAMLASTSIGAIWSSCSPDFGLQGVYDRFGQIAPKLLFVADGYFYNDKTIDSLPRIRDIIAQLDSLQLVVTVAVVNEAPDLSILPKSVLWQDFIARGSSAKDIDFAQLPFDHPLYILYSSGTTGVPKSIVHGAGGTLIQHLKEHQLHTDISRDDVLFYFTTCGWMMWNWLVSGLASGTTVVLYDGSPLAKKAQVLLDIIEREKITVYGTSAKFISALEKLALKPMLSHGLSSVRTVLSTGSPLSDRNFDYIYRDFKVDVCLASICGGTDIISCFALGNANLPVRRGQLQCIGLGIALEIWDDDGNAMASGQGELVASKGFPSAPVKFWNDSDGQKYHNAYFNHFDGVWRQGDIAQVTAQHGVIIRGRSDGVLNPGGVRIGTAEIYRQVEKVGQVFDSVVIGQQWQDDIRVVLFVMLNGDLMLDDALASEIKQTIRQHTTARHVPEKIIQVPDIPRTISGKTAELAVQHMVHGKEVKNIDALANPEVLQFYGQLASLSS